MYEEWFNSFGVVHYWGPTDTPHIKQYRLLQLFLVILQNLTVRPYIEDTTYLSHRTRWIQAGTHLEASLLLASFNGAWRCCAIYWRRKILFYHIQMWTMGATTKTGQLVQWWCELHGSKHFLIRLKSHSIRWNTYLESILGK